MEQLDVAGSGSLDQAAFAASQMDWRSLQQDYAGLWLEMAERCVAACARA